MTFKIEFYNCSCQLSNVNNINLIELFEKTQIYDKLYKIKYNDHYDKHLIFELNNRIYINLFSNGDVKFNYTIKQSTNPVNYIQPSYILLKVNEIMIYFCKIILNNEYSFIIKNISIIHKSISNYIQ
jgi:hypothetical protein